MSFQERFPETYKGIRIDRHVPEALAELDYSDELELKNAALAAEVADTLPPELLWPIVPSPLARGWRTTGKRRVTVKGGDIYFHMGRSHGAEKVFISPLEPVIHGEIYRFVHKQLAMAGNRRTAANMNYCIIRGAYLEHAVIFNMRELSGDIVRALRNIASRLTSAFPAVRSTFIYLDESASDYYLEAERPVGRISFKKISGTDRLALKLNGKKFLYPVTSFSQINESILPVFAEKLSEELQLDGDTMLADIYCGYGLWSMACGGAAGKIWGADIAPQAIAAAVSNSGFHCKGRDFHYETLSVTGEALRRRMPPAGRMREVVLLDLSH